MRWTIEFPVQVYASAEEDDTLEPRTAPEAPVSVRNAIAEALWSLGQALSRTTHQLTLVATVEEPADLNGGDHVDRKRR